MVNLRPGEGSNERVPPARSSRPAATIADVARQAQVSAAVVSRVLNNDSALRVRDETRQRVWLAADLLNYTPNHTGRSLRLARTGAIALIEHGVHDPIHGEMLRGIQQRAAAEGYVVFLADAQQLGDDEQLYRSLFTSGRVDGVILHLGPHATDRHLWQVANSNVPTVLMNCYTEGGAGSVVLADEEAGAVAAQHLIDLGHRSVAFVAGTGSPPQSDRRRHGVERVLEASGYELWAGPSISVPADVAANGDSANAWWGRSMVQKLLRAPSPPTGIVVANVSAALGALAAAHEQGARVPHDVSIVGILDAWVADMTVPALTTVTLPLLELGSSAAELLMRIINDSSAVSERNIVVDHPKSQLIERSSTAPPLARKKGFGSTRSSARSGGGAPPARA